ncbi:hypothetical protein E0W68_07090 [Flavobacterium salilacus subsp. salilacus]|uniref:DUF6327 family protein n=1 Tax=Flavobacterium TaxID=237 RepID=UPI0010750AF3|nr:MULTISPECIES: DUF6327 family protein [Flavobacterium]KAF2519016.1 hypothetical protein E0W68_07090 [Flavobacterium salilacus subsp. salilacus]MBE1614821.1 hypothetical protein [Flavobacterium sp. SaA2.13]NDI98518.1 hypothetical protein [Flavobacterium salilacus subsp. altitudinum]
MALDKVYTTFDEINRDLEILKVEKELSYYRFKKELVITKESFEPKNLIGKTPAKILGFLSMLSGPIKSAILTMIFKKIFK